MYLLIFLMLCSSIVVAQQNPNNSYADWTTQCKNLVLTALNEPNGTSRSPPILVGINGIHNLNQNLSGAWGIDYATCTRECGGILGDFSFDNFSNELTNWLLPWLALTAQLPFETSGPFNDIMSMLLAVGSPAHITYGLVMTMLTRRRISDLFERLIMAAKQNPVYPELIQRLRQARYLLQETQQAPMRAQEVDGWLSSLLLLEGNDIWWTSVTKSLKNTRRGITTSLIVQILFAAIAWLFTVVAAFDDLGDVATALSISSSSIWLWMIPVIAGWVAVGTQRIRHSILDILTDPYIHAYHVQSKLHDAENALQPVQGMQSGIISRTGLLPNITAPPSAGRGSAQLSDLSSVNGLSTTLARSKHGSSRDDIVSYDEPHRMMLNDAGDIPLHEINSGDNEAMLFAPRRAPARLWVFDFTGDEGKEGPIYNYARVFTHARFAETISEAFASAIRNIHTGKSPQGSWTQGLHLHQNLSGTSRQISEFCGFDATARSYRQRSSKAYAEWSEIPSEVSRDMLIACLMALFVQWGTTGPSIIIGYLTASAGLGCRSGSYLLYGCLGTISWGLMVIASCISHELMLRAQRDPTQRPGGFLPYLFIFTRFSGQFLAFVNAIWLLLASVFELSGVLDTCWCNSDYISLGSKHGWVMLFKDANQLAPYAQRNWIGGVVFAVVVCFLSCAFIGLGVKEKED